MNQLLSRCFKQSRACITYTTCKNLKNFVPIVVTQFKTYATDTKEIKFGDIKTAYKSKTTYELLRASFVFQMCSVNYLVENGMKIANATEKVLGERLFTFLVKSTFFGHFVAGEYPTDIPEVIRGLQKFNICGMINYSVEDDIHDDVTGQVNEKKCDELMQALLDCITEAASVTDQGFIAIKLTALTNPNILLNKYSELLRKSHEIFIEISENKENLADRKFDIKTFQSKIKEMGIVMNPEDSQHWFSLMDQNQTGFVNFFNWNELIVKGREFRKSFAKVGKDGKAKQIFPEISVEDEAQTERLINRVDILSKKASDCNIRMMIDAEQTYFQPAISRITVEMMRKYNKGKTVIMNTYQAYLKETEEKLKFDLALSHKQDFHFGLKLVRGAYMEHERERAQTMNYDDLVQDNYKNTTKNYHKLLTFLLKNIQRNNKSTFLMASHNEDTVKFAIKTLNELGLENCPNIYFGQLLGMCDHVTFPLAESGKQVIKNIPIGPVKEVLPYLHRRAMENKSVLQRLRTERRLIRKEIFRRSKLKIGFKT